MTFHDVRLETTIATGATGGPRFGTIIQETASGHEYRITRQSTGRRVFEFSKTLLDPGGDGGAAYLLEFAAARRGNLHSFRLKDWSNYSTAIDKKATPAATDIVLGTGDGATTQFALRELHEGSGPNPYSPLITLPVAGTVVAALDGTPTTSFTLTNPGGVLTFASAPGSGVVVTAGCEFDVPVRFDLRDDWVAIDLVEGLLSQWNRIRCVEVLDESENPDAWPTGGSETQTIDQNASITFANRVWHFVVTSGARTITLPDPARQVGGSQFVVINDVSSGGTIQIKDHEGNNVGSGFGGGGIKELLLVRSGSTATWWIR